MLIRNFDQLATSPERKTVLTLLEEGLQSIQADTVVSRHIQLQGTLLTIQDKKFDLENYKRVFVVAFGKGSSGIAKILESLLGERLTQGWCIDVTDASFASISYTKGTHPLPSETNIAFTRDVLAELKEMQSTDLVLVVICGGGSVMFEDPRISLADLTATVEALLKSGADIREMNMVRKHVSRTKGGGLIQLLSPATIISLIFSDVPGNDLATIASGPTVPDPTTVADAVEVLKKYNLLGVVPITQQDLVETPKELSLFDRVFSFLLVNNMTVLTAMQEKAKSLGYASRILSDHFQAEAKEAGKQLLALIQPGEIMLVGGETTVKVTGQGHGGRNQELVLASLSFLDDKTIIASIDTDGWDFYGFAGAIGDSKTKEKAAALGLDINSLLVDNNAYAFFEKTGDGIDTGKLQSNVSDIMIIMKENF